MRNEDHKLFECPKCNKLREQRDRARSLLRRFRKQIGGGNGWAYLTVDLNDFRKKYNAAMADEANNE